MGPNKKQTGIAKFFRRSAGSGKDVSPVSGVIPQTTENKNSDRQHQQSQRRLTPLKRSAWEIETVPTVQPVSLIQGHHVDGIEQQHPLSEQCSSIVLL